MSLYLFNILVILGSFQGTVTGLLLGFSSRRTVSRTILSGLLLVFVVLSVKILLHTLNLWQTPYLRYFPLALELAIQPLFYLYVLSLTLPAFRITRKELYHFIPVALFMIHAIVVYVRIAGVADLALKDTLAEQLHFNLVKRTEDYLVILSSCIYWYVSYRKILHYRQWLYTHVSASDYPEYVWLRNILILTAILFTALAINMLLDYGFGFGKVYFLHWQLFFLYMSGLIYFLGFKGYHQPTYVLAAPASIYTPALAPETERGVNHSLKEGIEKALTEEKLYLDPDLSLASLAAHLGTSPAVLSATINTVYEKNFRNLINEYRVEAVKKKLTDPACSHLSILGIALECGFNSEASFYRTFKKYTSLSPKEYIEGQNTIT